MNNDNYVNPMTIHSHPITWAYCIICVIRIQSHKFETKRAILKGRFESFDLMMEQLDYIKFTSDQVRSIVRDMTTQPELEDYLTAEDSHIEYLIDKAREESTFPEYVEW